MNILGYLIPPIVGGSIALFTNWIAIRMLFRPHTEKRIFGIRVPFTPGLVPKEWDRLAFKLSQAISTKLLTPDVLAKELANPDLWPLPDITISELMDKLGVDSVDLLKEPIGNYLKTLSDNKLPNILDKAQTLPETYPWLEEKFAAFTYKIIEENTGKFASLFISKEKIYNSIKDGLFSYLSTEENQKILIAKIHEIIDTVLDHGFINETIPNFNIKTGLGQIIEKEKVLIESILKVLASYFATHIPVQKIIENKLKSFEISEAEEIILNVVGRELRMIVILGGILGFIIGLVLLVI